MPRILALVQGTYYIAAAALALFLVDLVQELTEPNADLLVIQAVAVLVIPIGACLVVVARRHRIGIGIGMLASLSALGLIGFEIVYWTRGGLGPMSLLDALLETVFLGRWAGWFLSLRRERLRIRTGAQDSRARP